MDNRSWSDYAYPFAAWDVRLYLDTHPDDAGALETYRSLCRQAKNAGMPCGGPACHIPDDGVSNWTWISDPWPWEPDANTVSGSRCGCTDTPVPASADIGARADVRSCGCGGTPVNTVPAVPVGRCSEIPSGCGGNPANGGVSVNNGIHANNSISANSGIPSNRNIPADNGISANGRCGCCNPCRPCTPCGCKPMPEPVPAARNAQRNASGVGSGRSAYRCI